MSKELNQFHYEHCEACRGSGLVKVPLKEEANLQAAKPADLCKYGNEKKSCTSSPMDCQCVLDATFAMDKPAEGSLPVVAWVRYCLDGGAEGPILDSDRRMCEVRRTSGNWTPLTDHAQATAEIAKRDEEIAWQKQLIEKMEHAVKHDAAELTTLRAQMEGVVGALQTIIANGPFTAGQQALFDSASEALATYQSTQGDKN